MVFPVVQVTEVQMPHPPVCIPIPCPLRGCPMSCPHPLPHLCFLWHGTAPGAGHNPLAAALSPPIPLFLPALPHAVHCLFFYYFNCNHSLSVSLLFLFIFFYFWDLSFQFNLLISVLISLCRLFADFTRHNFYQLVLKDA